MSLTKPCALSMGLMTLASATVLDSGSCHDGFKEHNQPALAVNVAIGQSVAQSINKTIQTGSLSQQNLDWSLYHP